MGLLSGVLLQYPYKGPYSLDLDRDIEPKLQNLIRKILQLAEANVLGDAR